MHLYLFRHGPAGRRDPSSWPEDGKRPLTARGEERTRRAARGLARLEPRPSLILTSPLVRAHQTARLLREAFETNVPVEVSEALGPGASPRAALDLLRKHGTDETLVLVGHEPHLGLLAGFLAFEATGIALPLKKAGVLLLEFTGPIQPGTARLQWILTPRLLRRLGRKGARV